MAIESLTFTHLGPFDKAEFQFDPQINVLVGPNNTGKTTALLALAEAVITPFGFPTKLVRQGSAIEISCHCSGDKPVVHHGPMPITANEKGHWNAARTGDLKATQEKLGFCAYIPAIRFNTNYRSRGPALSFDEANPQQMLVRETLRGMVVEGEKKDYENPVSMLRDDRIVHEIINLDYRAYRENDPTIREVVDRIASLASQITEGFPIVFSGVAERDNGYYLEFKTPDGQVPLNVLSQGTQSLIQWVGRLVVGYARHYNFEKDHAERPAVLIIDEIDAHLHPGWQRRILPALSQAYPKLQIFCSTHSPLMLAGLNAGQIHLLRRGSKGHIDISRNEADVHGWSADEILSHFLGIASATDLGTESDLQRLRALRGKIKLTAKEMMDLEQLRTKVQTALQNGPLASLNEVLHAKPSGAKADLDSSKKAPSAHQPKPNRGRMLVRGPRT